jgi:erythromycin esterase
MAAPLSKIQAGFVLNKEYQTMGHRLGFVALTLFVFVFAAAGYSAEGPVQLSRTSDFERTLEKGVSDHYFVALTTGQSTLIIVKQEGVDVVIDVTAPSGALLASVDSPTGRYGDEVVEIFAHEKGDYGLRIHAIDDQEPAGKYRVTVREMRSVESTREVLASRQRARDEASKWLAVRSAGLPGFDSIRKQSTLPLVDSLADEAQVVGLGEATHGSREFGDVRLALTERLIEQHGYRVVAIEGSATAMRVIAPYIKGGSEKTPEMDRVIESGWIGRRARRQLIEWLRNWNRSHAESQVTLVGVDAQENGKSQEILAAFLQRAYSGQVVDQWKDVAKELAAADAQTPVFGDSEVNDKAGQFLNELLAKMVLDALILRARLGDETYAQAFRAAEDLVEFSDFNSEKGGALGHSRDWYMAAEVLRAAQGQEGPTRKVVFWAHNAHVAARNQTTGAVLRSALGCNYAPVAITFGQGDFVAQIPNDLQDRLAVSTVPANEGETIESVLAKVQTGPLMASWPCGSARPDVPEWLGKAQSMHWVGGLYAPSTPASGAFRSFDLLHDFDAIIYFPKVSAEEIPVDRPLIPARQR